MKFEYDPQKSAANQEKHGIDFESAREQWLDARAVIIDLPERAEPRSMVIGRMRNRMWSAIITYRGDAVRIISVRRSRDKEIAVYDAYNHLE